MIQSEDFKDMKPGTELWSVYPGKVVRIVFRSVARTPSIWGNFSDDLLVEFDGLGLTPGYECREIYRNLVDAKKSALEQEIRDRKESVINAEKKLAAAKAKADMPLIVEIVDE
ncbi:hypothetical protein VPHD148_0028 [Vibrio phage D148]